MTQIIQNFEKANPSIHVNAQYIQPGPGYTQALLTQIQGGNAPDVFYTTGGSASNGSASVLPLAKAGKLLDLSSQPWASAVPTAAHNLFYSGSGLYGLPLYESPLSVIYNATEFKKLGLTAPSTFSGLLALCTKIHSDGKTGIALPGQTAAQVPIEIAANTVYANTPTWNTQRTAGQTTFAGTAGWQEALQHYVAMDKQGCFQAGAAGSSVPQAFQLVAGGQALMFVGPVDAIGVLSGLAKGSTFAAFPLPGDSPASTRAMVTYSDALAVSATSANKAGATKFIDFVASPAQAALLAKLSGAISISQASSGDLPSNLSAFVPFYKANKVTPYAPDEWISEGVLNAFDPVTTGLLTGQQTVSGGLKSIDQAWTTQ